MGKPFTSFSRPLALLQESFSNIQSQIVEEMLALAGKRGILLAIVWLESRVNVLKQRQAQGMRN